MSQEDNGLEQLGAHFEQMTAHFAKELSYCVNALGACATPGVLDQVLEKGEAPVLRDELGKRGAAVLALMEHLNLAMDEDAAESFKITAIPEVLPPFLELVREADDTEASMARLSAAAREALVKLNIPIPEGR